MRLRLSLLVSVVLAISATPVDAAPKTIKVEEPREAVYRSRTPDYTVVLQLYGHLLKAHVTGRLLCVRSDGSTHYKHFKLRFENNLLGVGGPTGRFSVTSRPVSNGWTRYGVDEALGGEVGPPRTLPSSFDGAFEYAVRRPWVRCRAGTSTGSAEVPFRVERVMVGLPPRFPS